MSKPKYMVNGFLHVYDGLKRFLKGYDVEFVFPKFSKYDFVANYALVKKLVANGEMEKYDVVHINTWEGILAYEKRNPKQLFIAHAHGFYVGLSYDKTIVELPFAKRTLARVQKAVLDSAMKRKLREADIFYVAAPNMVGPARKEIRKDAMWLPNPIDTSVFRPDGAKKRFEGNPSVFLPTRMHAFKNPLFAAKLFRKIKSRYPGAKLHIINYGRGADPLYDEFMRIVFDRNDVIPHKRMNRDELSTFYRGADIVLGQFNPELATMGLIELEAMASGAAIVTLDIYEMHTGMDKLEGLAFKLIEDRKFREDSIKKNLEYVRKVHSEKAVAKLHAANLKRFMKGASSSR